MPGEWQPTREQIEAGALAILNERLRQNRMPPVANLDMLYPRTLLEVTADAEAALLALRLFWRQGCVAEGIEPGRPRDTPMSELQNVDLKLILRNTEQASRDSRAAMEATERLVISIGARFDALESRFASLEARMNGLERRVGSTETTVDSIARSNHRIEQTLADSNHRIEQMLSDILTRIAG